MNFKCATDQAYDKAFPMFLFSVQYSYYYSIFYFLYFSIYVFDVFLINPLMHNVSKWSDTL